MKKLSERNTQIHRDYIAGKATIGQLAIQHNITRQRVWQIICYFDPSAPLTARMVDAMGWRYLCLSENGMVDRAHFLKGYDQLRDREAHGRVQLPGVKQLAEKLSQSKQLAAQE